MSPRSSKSAQNAFQEPCFIGQKLPVTYTSTIVFVVQLLCLSNYLHILKFTFKIVLINKRSICKQKFKSMRSQPPNKA